MHYIWVLCVHVMWVHVHACDMCACIWVLCVHVMLVHVIACGDHVCMWVYVCACESTRVHVSVFGFM